MIKTYLLTITILFSVLSLFAQDTILTNYFKAPLNIPLYLAGNFGELRSNHFHSGIDIKTQGREGFKVYASADGHVSRIKISPWGYGKTIYIDHPNGYTTVYAHLKSFKGKLADFIVGHQYKTESWEMDYYPPDTLLQVKKGDVIALSGNTGGSGGPHLHFEIRETETEFPVNPLLFGFKIKDNIKPIIKRIAVFPLNDTSVVNNKRKMQYFSVTGSNGTYKLKYPSTISVYGEIGFGIETIDKLNGVPNRNGIYSIELSKNKEVIYRSEMKKFSFDQSRALNSLIDYPTYLKQKVRFQKSFIAPNNQLGIYSASENSGIVHFSLNDKSTFKYSVKDSYKNLSTITFSIAGHSKKPQQQKLIDQKIDTTFSYLDSNIYQSKNITVTIPKDALYENLPFQYALGDTLAGAITPTYYIHNEFTPLHHPIEIAIKVGRLSEYMRSKAAIVHYDRKKRLYAKSSSWRNNSIITTSKSFGKYTVMIDTIPPKIVPLNISKNKNMSNSSTISIKIGDNLSGIKSYRGSIDGKWILMEYEAKKAPKGKHNFELTLTDAVGNTASTSIPFIR